MSTSNNEIIDIEERDGYNMEIMMYLGLIYIYLLNKQNYQKCLDCHIVYDLGK